MEQLGQIVLEVHKKYEDVQRSGTITVDIPVGVIVAVEKEEEGELENIGEIMAPACSNNCKGKAKEVIITPQVVPRSWRKVKTLNKNN